MSKIYKASIDEMKIPKDLLRTHKKDGTPYKNNAKYLNITIFINEEKDKDGNIGSIKVDVPKNDSRKIYLGYLQELDKKEQPTAEKPDNDDLPF